MEECDQFMWLYSDVWYCACVGRVLALPWPPQKSSVSPANPRASAFCLDSSPFPPDLRPSPWEFQPLFLALHSSAPSSDGTVPGSTTPDRSHRCPSSQAPGQKTERTSLPSCVACQSGKSLKWRKRHRGACQRNTHCHLDCSHRRSPLRFHECCSLWVSPDAFAAVGPGFSIAPHGPAHQHWSGLFGIWLSSG